MPFMTVDRRGRGTFPEEVRRELGLGSGDTNLVILERTDRGTFELVPASLVPKDQLWFHHPDVQARVAEAEADFREGRFTRTDTPEEAQAYLDSLKRAAE
ncbi:MAG TPA: AbrB/MazE/SpoVT family DNA-binding domain-containing protein [Longimicrobium sp.]|jgi:bifunctional DNA-binding transcriptional regulator/antitoxin component of YhaV-PrlF toxin-antitoxin module|nr:AbrB/MazE/SpoVT family DNA-binding domain-containing protein [Longimicrobium sp.]